MLSKLLFLMRSKRKYEIRTHKNTFASISSTRITCRSCTNSLRRLCSVCSSLATVSSSPFRSLRACSRRSFDWLWQKQNNKTKRINHLYTQNLLAHDSISRSRSLFLVLIYIYYVIFFSAHWLFLLFVAFLHWLLQNISMHIFPYAHFVLCATINNTFGYITYVYTIKMWYLCCCCYLLHCVCVCVCLWVTICLKEACVYSFPLRPAWSQQAKRFFFWGGW